MWNMSIIKTCQYPLVTLFVLNNGISMRLFDNEKVRLSILRNEYDEDHTKNRYIISNMNLNASIKNVRSEHCRPN